VDSSGKPENDKALSTFPRLAEARVLSPPVCHGAADRRRYSGAQAIFAAFFFTTPMIPCA
jgi:hypothetical protein